MNKGSLLVLAIAIGVVAAQTPMSLRQPVTGKLPAAADQTNPPRNCYQLTLDDATVREVVWWDAGKLLLRSTPCKGFPHMKVSVYGCPSATKTVYEFMSEKMKNDALVSGKPVPADWEWPGDVETLTIDITHKTYFIEVENRPQVSNGATVASEYTLEANIFNANATDGGPTKKEDLFPLKYFSPWDKKVARENSTDDQGSFSFGGGATSNVVSITWWPPGMPGGVIDTIKTEKYEYAVFVKEITERIGTSSSAAANPGAFVNYIAGDAVTKKLCPGSETTVCTSDNCRSCKDDYPDCPKEFLTNCDETTLNVAKLKTALDDANPPFEGYVKDASRWTAWTSCGASLTMDRVDATSAFKQFSSDNGEDERRNEPIVWFKQGGSELEWTTEGKLKLAVSGLKDDNNNVYMINVVVRKDPTTLTVDSVSNTTGVAENVAYEFMTLQMRTPRYQTPKLSSTDNAVIIGVSVGLGCCILIFVVVAAVVRTKRKKKLAQRIRMKK